MYSTFPAKTGDKTKSRSVIINNADFINADLKTNLRIILILATLMLHPIESLNHLVDEPLHKKRPTVPPQPFSSKLNKVC